MQAPQSRPAPHAALSSRHDLDAALADDRGQLLARLAPARAQERRLLGRAAALDRQQLADQRLARAAARARAGDVDDLERRAEPARADGVDDLALADAVAVAHAGAVGEVGGGGLARPRRAARAGRRASRPVRTASISSSAPRDVAEQDRADGAALGVDDQLAVAARRRRRTTARAPSGAPAQTRSTPITLSFAVGIEPVYAARSPQSVAAATFACSWIGATMPCTTPRCCGALADGEHARVARSPARRRRRSRARRSARRRARASTCGRMPTEMTTRSAGSTSPPASRTPSARDLLRVALEQDRRRRAPPSRARAARPRRRRAGAPSGGP